MRNFTLTLQHTIAEALPGVLGAILILALGWFVANAVRFFLSRLLGAINLNDKFNKTSGEQEPNLDLEGGVAQIGFLLVIFLTIMMVLNQLGLEVASEPFSKILSQIGDYLPKLGGGIALAIVAWFCAVIGKHGVAGLFSSFGLDEKIQTSKRPFSVVAGDIAFWVILFIFLPGILGVFQLEGLLEPAQLMLGKVTYMLPNIFGGILIILIGWFIAKILREVVTNILDVAGVDEFGKKIGLGENINLPNIGGVIVYFFVFVPALIAGLNALKISAISDPATKMLSDIMAAVPNIIAAVAVLLIVYLIAKPVSQIADKFFQGVGVDSLPQKMGLKNFNAQAGTLSDFLAKTIFFFMMLFACVEAANRLGFYQFSGLVTVFIQFGGQVLLGSLIIAVGLWLANVATTAMSATNSGKSSVLAGILRFVILGLVLAMGLRAMGVANDIVNMAFGLTLGAMAVAFALAFGIGGREAAGKQLEYWFKKLRGED